MFVCAGSAADRRERSHLVVRHGAGGRPGVDAKPGAPAFHALIITVCSAIVGRLTLNVAQEKVAELVRKLGPLIAALGAALNQLEPYVMQAYRAIMVAWKLIEPYHPEELGGAVFGLFLAFFGGRCDAPFAASDCVSASLFD